jgi:glycosyltransferase involved in cell wall biosynthesis
VTVFISIPWFLPAYRAGGPIQSVANLVNNFKEEGICYKIFCSNTDLNNEVLPDVITDEWVAYNNHTQVWYASKQITAALKAQVKAIQPDAIFIIGIFSWQFNVVPLLFCKAPKKILSVRGMLHSGALTQKKWKKRFFLQGLKIFAVESKTIFHATDNVEAGFIKKEFGQQANVAVAGNFAKVVNRGAPLFKQAGFLNMVTIALISPMKNHLLVLEALMYCTANINYSIYGPIKDAAYWQACLAQISLLPKNIQVHYHGELAPTKIAAVLVQNHLFIMPSKSENFGHAISEALSACKPVITSQHTPWDALLENNAGMNVATEQFEISTAINFFADMQNETYLQFVTGTGIYSDNNLNTTANTNAYRSLFFDK